VRSVAEPLVRRHRACAARGRAHDRWRTRSGPDGGAIDRRYRRSSIRSRGRGGQVIEEPAPGSGRGRGGDPAGMDLVAAQRGPGGVVGAETKAAHKRGSKVATALTGHRGAQAGTAAGCLRLQGAAVRTAPGRGVGNVAAGIEDRHGRRPDRALSPLDRAPAGPSARDRRWTRWAPIHRPWAAGRGRSSRPRAAAHWG
jgi:hypothetical protein